MATRALKKNKVGGRVREGAPVLDGVVKELDGGRQPAVRMDTREKCLRQREQQVQRPRGGSMLVYLRKSKEVIVAGAEGVRGRQTRDDSLDVGRKQIKPGLISPLGTSPVLSC